MMDHIKRGTKAINRVSPELEIRLLYALADSNVSSFPRFEVTTVVCLASNSHSVGNHRVHLSEEVTCDDNNGAQRQQTLRDYT